MTAPSVEFLDAYARHRAAEGRALSSEALHSLPYLCHGPLARQWSIRARTYAAFLRHVVLPMAKARSTPLQILDLGAGNGWLCHRLCQFGHSTVAVDIREDDVDGLGAAAAWEVEWATQFTRLTASFEDLPLTNGCFDIVVFNASLHYARELSRALDEAKRTAKPGGIIAILDSPFYRCEADGRAMVAEKRAQGEARFGAAANILLAQNFIEYLTHGRLNEAASTLSWQRHVVFYP
ncbi:MAG TPA: class I SAM-dependent methyltransferase, partial [Rhizomicrobium sp.]|nr:class I SAM-dependent methyltransferase [Rhizomicrobium sp.]